MGETRTYSLAEVADPSYQDGTSGGSASPLAVNEATEDTEETYILGGKTIIKTAGLLAIAMVGAILGQHMGDRYGATISEEARGVFSGLGLWAGVGASAATLATVGATLYIRNLLTSRR